MTNTMDYKNLEPISFNKMLLFPVKYQGECIFTDIDPITFAKMQLNKEPSKSWERKIDQQTIDLTFQSNILQHKPLSYSDAKEQIIENLIPEYLEDTEFQQRIMDECHIKYPIDILIQFIHNEYMLTHTNASNEIYLHELNGTNVELESYFSNYKSPDMSEYMAFDDYKEYELDIN